MLWTPASAWVLGAVTENADGTSSRRTLKGKQAQGGEAISCPNTAWDGTEPLAEQSLEGGAHAG
jgi:hypothetical protein